MIRYPSLLRFSSLQVLPGYHPSVRAKVSARLEAAGVRLSPSHRARVPEGFLGDTLTSAPIRWAGDPLGSYTGCVEGGWYLVMTVSK